MEKIKTWQFQLPDIILLGSDKYGKELKEIIIKQGYVRYYDYEDNIYDLTAERVEQC